MTDLIKTFITFIIKKDFEMLRQKMNVWMREKYSLIQKIIRKRDSQREREREKERGGERITLD